MDLLYLAEHFAAGGLVKPGFDSRFPNRLLDADRTDPRHIGRVLRDMKY